MPSKKLPSFDRALLSELARGAQKTFDNADALYREAKILGAAGALGRALFLHQISLEECAKIESLGAWATSLLAGYSVDEKKIIAGFASHAQKNRTNAYMLKGSTECNYGFGGAVADFVLVISGSRRRPRRSQVRGQLRHDPIATAG